MAAVQNITLAATFNVRIQEILSYAGVSSTVLSTLPATQRYSFTNGLSTGGTVAGKCDLWYAKSNTLASGVSKTYTLSNLTGADADDSGRTVPFVRIRLGLLWVSARTGNDFFTLGNAAANPWAAPFGSSTHTAKVRTLWWMIDDSPAALVVTASSSDQLKIINSGSASMSYQLILGGNSD